MKSDILKLAAEAYEQLTNVEYHIVLGRKGIITNLDVIFSKDNFYHLAGFHKLKQRYAFQQHTSSWILKKILDGTMDMKLIENDQNFCKLADRLFALRVFKQVIDSVKTSFYSFDGRKVSFATKIKADYLAKGCIEKNPVVFSFLF